VDPKLMLWTLAIPAAALFALFWNYKYYKSVRIVYAISVLSAASAATILPWLIRYTSAREVLCDIIFGSLSMCAIALCNIKAQTPKVFPITAEEAEFLAEQKYQREQSLRYMPEEPEDAISRRAQERHWLNSPTQRNLPMLLFFALIAVITVPLLLRVL